MPTDIDIASNALILIGDDPISSFTEPGAGAQAAANLYQPTYRALLATHPWTFALKEQKLSQLSQSPDDLTNFKYAYQIPTDSIRIWALLPHSNYIIIGSLIYSNETQLLARYVYQVAETSLPPSFVQALEYKLAADFSLLVTEDKAKAELFDGKFTLSAGMARTIDSQQKPQQPIIDSPFTDVRLNGIGSF